MIAKLKLFTITLILSSTVFSQQSTNKICLSTPIAKKIAIELTQCDSIKIELQQTQHVLNLVHLKSQYQDSTISIYRKKTTVNDSIVKAYQNQTIQYQSLVEQLTKEKQQMEEQLERSQILSNWLTGGMLAFIGIFVGNTIK